MTQPDAYLFDMDGLLLDTEQAYLDAAYDVLIPRGMAKPDVEALFLSLVGASAAHTSVRLTEAFGTAAAEIEAEWRDAHIANMDVKVPVKAGVRTGLDRLAEAGVPCAVVTSTQGAMARHHLKRAGLTDYFKKIIAGDEVPANKPDPAPYQMAAKALGADPTRCAAFEDSDRGIASAVAAGCVSVQIPDLRPPGVPLPSLGQYRAATFLDALHIIAAHDWD